MTATIRRVKHAHSQFQEITLAAGDEVAIDFRGLPDNVSASPNRERGIRVRTEAATGIAVSASVSLGDALRIEDSTVVAAWATATKFWTARGLTAYDGAAAQYLRHVPSDDVRRISAYDDKTGEMDLTEGFRRIIAPTAVSTSANLITVAAADLALVSTGDAIDVSATGGIGGLTAGTTYYAIKVTGGSAGLKLATTAANAAAGTAVSLTAEGAPADARLDLDITVSNGDKLKLHPAQDPPEPISAAAGGTAGRLRLSASAQGQVHAHTDLGIRIGSVDEVRRVESVSVDYTAAGETATGFSYSSTLKTFTAPAEGEAWRVIEPVGVVVVTDSGGFVNFPEGSAWEVELGGVRSFKLLQNETPVTLDGGSVAASAVDVATDSFTSSSADFGKLKTGDRVHIQGTGGYTGISNDAYYYLIKNGTTGKFASSRANAEAGTALPISGSGTPGNLRFNTGNAADIVLSHATGQPAYVLTEPFSAAPADGAAVSLVSGTGIGLTSAIVETQTQATTTVVPLRDFASGLSAAHDVEIDGQLRALAADGANAAAKTVTLATALSAAPEPGDPVEFGLRTSAFNEIGGLTLDAGTGTAEASIEYPVAGLKFAATGTGALRATVEIIGTWIPEAKIRS